MSKTRHMRERMAQRNIDDRLVQAVLMLGAADGERVVLDKTDSAAYLKRLRKLIKDIERIYRRGGLVVVEEDQTLITVYELDSYSRRQLQNKNKVVH